MSARPRSWYFGCIGEPGHVWWPVKKPDGLPWMPHEYDGGMTSTISTRQGVARLHHRDGWTALDVHDYTGDSRGGSHSLFVVNEIVTLEQVVALARGTFPSVVDRLGPITEEDR